MSYLRTAALPSLLCALPCALALAGAIGCDTPVEEVPSLYDDPAILAQVQANDGVEAEVPRFGAFAFGEPVYYWDFGLRDTSTMSAYLLCRRSGSRCSPIDHPAIVEAVPGEAAYRSFAHIFHVPIRGGFDEGERIASVEELNQAVADGLLDAPERTQTYRHCPIVAPEVRLEVATGRFAEPGPVYAHGGEARCFDFTPEEPLPLSPDLTMLVRNVYVLTRDGQGYPLSERLSGMDLNGDGDQRDSNNVFGTAHGRVDFTPLWRMVSVTVPASYGSIDTAADGQAVDYDDSHDMFDIAPDYTITPLPDRVLDHEETDTLIDCPLQAREGSL